MREPYPILQVRPDEILGDEALGSKPKFWFSRGDEQWLFKEARDSTGEDWAEKIAAEVAAVLELPAARVELAEFNGRNGCASLSFVDTDSGQALIHGNEILAGLVTRYDPDKRWRQSEHNLKNIYKAITQLLPSEMQRDAVLSQLASYLVLDALIGNTDRHHENWGLLWQVSTDPVNPPTSGFKIQFSVAPSFDHASSLGRELLDVKRSQVLERHAVADYLRRGRGGVYLSATDAHGANPVELVEYGMREYRPYFTPAVQRLRETDIEILVATVDRVPESRMSSVAREFSKALMREAYSAITELN